ncbi:hypothetical protein RRG08_046876 [Elysia crispata]|uniref:Uncharacterized protein n=1 Tax=Elysia crispata TaxID=231223 RepID=A0AAE1DGK0_9GAST|nr:hypothetical protein RRG08_046876 [Elysia crispata]
MWSQCLKSDQMIRDTLIVCLADDIRLDVLGQADQDMSLDTIRFIEAKENGKSSAGRINSLPQCPPLHQSTQKAAHIDK